MDAFRLGYDKGADDTRRRDHERINDEALLRQALEALETTDEGDYGKQWYDTVKVEDAIAALKERLK
jgi:hypothetical protein